MKEDRGEDREEPRWISALLLRTIHADQVRRHGGALGLRDEDDLQSALARPRNRWHYDEEADLAILAAAYGFALLRNHPFVDGNKRTAFLAAYVFLGLNGRRLGAGEPEVVELMLAAASGEIDESDLAAWLRDRIEPR